MKKIGSFFYAICSVITLLGLFAPRAWAQSGASVQATVSQTTIYTGERIQLSIRVSGNFNEVSRPSLPEFKGFRLLSNMPSTSRSYRYVNGQSSTTYSYSYQLIAQQKGSYTIPPVTITIDGQEHQTDPIDVTIVDRNQAAGSNGAQQPDIFLKMDISDHQPVTGQQIITDVVLYFQDGLEVNSYQPVPGWKAQGFWKEQLNNTGPPQATSTIINGVRYRKARLLQFALFPTKDGELEISPYKIMVSVRTMSRRDDPFSSFFGGLSNSQRQIELKTDPISVDVRPLPDAGDATYIGAVGDFNISRTISTQQVQVGESIEITTRINGTGNIPLISKPSYHFPNGLEVYDPQEKTDLNRQNHRISGNKIFTDVIIPRAPGDYTIPEKEVAYFDPAKGAYVSVTLPALRFGVRPGANTAAATGSEVGGLPVNPITGLAHWTIPASQDLTSHWWFWFGLLAPLVLLAVAYWQKTYRDRMRNDRAFARSERAYETATDRLNRALELSEQDNIKQAYNMLQKAITGFIGDRLNLAEAGLSNQDYLRALKEQQIDKELIKNIRMLLDKCASISYAPEITSEYLKSHVGLAESTLEKLKKVL